MNSLLKSAIIISAIVLGGAFLSYFFWNESGNPALSLLLGFYYPAALFAIFFVLHKLLGSKLGVFSAGQQWLLKAVLYLMAFTLVYLAGLMLQIVLIYPLSLEDLRLATWSMLADVITATAEEKDLRQLLSPEFRSFIFSFFALIVLVGLASVVGSWIEIRWKENRNRQALQKAELNALRSQIEPHFLFNALNTITSLIKNEPDKAEKLLIDLSDLLRYVFRNSDEERVPLARELEFARRYLALLQERFGDALVVNWHVSQNVEKIEVPVFLLQPLIENAINHGWSDKTKMLLLQINLARAKGALRIEISDNGAGIRQSRLRQLPQSGHALGNIAERLFLYYGRHDLLKIVSQSGRGTHVTITIPVDKK